MPPTPWQERFWRYVTPGMPDECWEWQGGRTEHGYGKLNRGGEGSRARNQVLKAHRASYEIHYGPFPPELDVCHHCDNPPCVNPDHLWLGDAKANAADMVAKGRWKGGARTPRVKITDTQVVELRERAAAGESREDLAASFQISTVQVWYIATGRSRCKVSGPLTTRDRRGRLVMLRAT